LVRVGEGPCTEYRVFGFCKCQTKLECKRCQLYDLLREAGCCEISTIEGNTIYTIRLADRALADVFPAFLDFMWYGPEKKKPDQAYLVPLLALGGAALGSKEVGKSCVTSFGEVQDPDTLVTCCADALRLLADESEVPPFFAKRILRRIKANKFLLTSPLMTEVANKDVWCQLLLANNKKPNDELRKLLVEFFSSLEQQGKLSSELFLELTTSRLLPPPSESAKEALCLVQLEQQVVGQEVALRRAPLEQRADGQLEGDDVGRGFELLTRLTRLQHCLIEALQKDTQPVNKQKMASALQGLPPKVTSRILLEAIYS